MMPLAGELSPAYSLLCPNFGGYTLLYICDRMMMLMRNSNRLIDDFKNQRKDTIWKQFDDTTDDQQEEEDDIDFDDFPEGSVHTDDETRFHARRPK